MRATLFWRQKVVCPILLHCIIFKQKQLCLTFFNFSEFQPPSDVLRALCVGQERAIGPNLVSSPLGQEVDQGSHF